MLALQPPFASQISPDSGPHEDPAGGGEPPERGQHFCGSQVAEEPSLRPREPQGEAASASGQCVSLRRVSPQVYVTATRAVISLRTRRPASSPGQHHPRNGLTPEMVSPQKHHPKSYVTPETASPQALCHPGNSAPQELGHLWSNVTPETPLPGSQDHPQHPRSGSQPALGPLCLLGYLGMGLLRLCPSTASRPRPQPLTRPVDPRLTTQPSQAGGTLAGAHSRRGCRRPPTATAWPRRGASRIWSPCRGPGS